jgi:hypothetical protein
MRRQQLSKGSRELTPEAPPPAAGHSRVSRYGLRSTIRKSGSQRFGDPDRRYSSTSSRMRDGQPDVGWPCLNCRSYAVIPLDPGASLRQQALWG